ncbi:DUF2939 domain-containing protein [Roseateles violae]|uniref:DUF2939 domain-containing protein n=1 Tax=Roseateles violae TaxID=3058042 RepID=A0ABT8DKR3_9BURK|nr:DUF2939 domain-containing protein [Pelomonas sp. PFR6]MDN3918999.1 DUF2939 domain-containing protein [Pelomonas sp. PFR6]
MKKGRLPIKPLLLGALALLLLLLGLYLSPYLALREMRSAAAAQDAQKLAGYVDVEAVRESLKRGLRGRLLGTRTEAVEAEPPTPARAMGAAVAAALLGPMVDAAITPASLARVLQGQRPAAAAVALPASEPAPTDEELLTEMGYESPNRFVVSVRKRGADEEPVDLVLRRDGVVSWKLAELRLP